MPRPIRALIDPQAIRHNLSVARSRAAGSRVWAVVKANAYGHDISMVYPEMVSADGFALLDFDEAVRVRALGWTGPILLLEGFFHPRDLEMVAAYGLTPVVHCDEQLAMIEAWRPQAPIPVYLKMNSGMNRVGFPPHRYRAAWERAHACAAVKSIGLMTHFADADGPGGVSRQIEQFNVGTAGIAGERCLSNSAATLWHPAAHGDWIRPGVMLYGASPSGVSSAVAGDLRPAMTLQSELISVQDLRQGDAVGYGGIFVADRAMRIGVVACGYADGYPRIAPLGTPIVVDGIRTQVVGRVSMDMISVDLGPCPNAHVGSPVEMWGRQLPIDDVARACGTVGYELMTAIAARVPKSLTPAGSMPGSI